MKKLGVSLFILVVALGLRVWRLGDADVTPDEYHYIHDGERLWHGDPYITIRHHPFFHPEPNMGHPFLVQVVMATGFKIWGSSIVTARLVSVVAGFGTVGLILWFDRRMPWRARATGALLYAILPLAVRFDRTAYLDSLLTLWVLGVGSSIWRYSQSGRREKIYLMLGGVAGGLAVATKLSGIFALLAGIILLGLVWWDEGRKRTLAKLFSWQLWFLAAGITVSWLLNDPAAYWNGIFHPADMEFQVLTLGYWMNGIGLFLAQIARASWFLLGPAMVGAGLYALVFMIRHQVQNFFLKFVCFWLLSLVGFLWLQPKSEYAWLPLLPPLVLMTAYVFNGLRRPSLVKRVTLGLLLATLPFTMWYGWRFKKLPYIRASHFYNRTIDDNFYRTIVQRVNQLTPQGGKVLFLPQQDYPYFALRPDISWSYYGDWSDFDVYVVDDKTQMPDDVTLVETLTAVEDEQELSRKIFRRQ
ncbi:MAG: glycosyltransferase family 39 protein [Candidatus Chisholmbacteria bacterium]|nr:glycosyltransferase family 39 protein [Candidatus Chisholmbacteria bacterium]